MKKIIHFEPLLLFSDKKIGWRRQGKIHDMQRYFVRENIKKTLKNNYSLSDYFVFYEQLCAAIDYLKEPVVEYEHITGVETVTNLLKELAKELAAKTKDEYKLARLVCSMQYYLLRMSSFMCYERLPLANSIAESLKETKNIIWKKRSQNISNLITKTKEGRQNGRVF